MDPNVEVEWSAGGRKRTSLDELVKEIYAESHIVVAIFEKDPEKLKWITRKLVRVAKPGSFFTNIEFYGINDAGCKSISEELDCDSSVVRLTLWSGKKIKEGMKYICFFLQKNQNITQLYLHNLSEEGVNIMLSNIENLNLSELSFDRAKISKQIYQFLFLVLKYNQTIKSFGFPTCSDNIPYEWIEDCFQENFTIEKCSYPQITKSVEWFVNRNRICNEMKASKAQRNSIPYNMDSKDIPKFLVDLQKSSEELRAMKLMVLGDGRIGKTTLLNAMKRILGQKYQETLNITSTVGIDYNSLQLAKGDISVWDFGGQIEYTATHSIFLSVEMAVMLVCFSLEVSKDEQMRQISFWLNFLNSSVKPPPLNPGKTSKWTIILVGVRADAQLDFSITENSANIIKEWKLLKWTQLPIVSTIFLVSALKSLQSVQDLLQFVTIECNRIFDVHAVQIPSTYHQFLFKLKTFAQNNIIIHWQQLYTEFKKDIKQDEATFKLMLQYCHSIGKIIWLPTEYVFTDPTQAVKIAANFISPKEVRLTLLKKHTEKVDILDKTDVGSLLAIDFTNNERLSQELELIIHLKICFPLKTADSSELLYLFPSLSSSAGESKFQFQKHLTVLQTMTGIRFMTFNDIIFIPRFFYQLLVILFQTLNINKQDIKLMAENGAIIQCPKLFFGEMLIILDIYRQSIIIAMSASDFGTEYAISIFNSLVQKEFPQYIKCKQEILCETCLQLCFVDTQIPINSIGIFKTYQKICSTHQHQKSKPLMLSHAHKKEKCNAHNQAEHNIFINYNKKTEGNKSQFSFVEPVGGAAEYLFSLLSVQKTKDGKPICVFWDKKCLNDQNWELEFTYGMRNSQIILLLMSNQTLATITENAHYQQNNVLFEYEAALLLYKCFKVPVFPIFLAELTKDKFIPFHFNHQFQHISHKRNHMAQKFIDNLSENLPRCEKFFLSSIIQTMNEIFQQQGIFMEERLENKLATNKLIQRILLTLEKAPLVSSTSLMSSSLSTISSTPVLSSSASSVLLASSQKTFNVNSPSTRSKRSAQGVLIIHSSLLQYSHKTKLGIGAQGIVYCAKWNLREVAFKELEVQHLLTVTDEKHKFMCELEVWRNINHPNAISLYGAVDDSGILGYVMEYCHNGNLYNHMAAGLVFGPKKTIDFACDIASILSHLHVSSIVHRDIKSSNVMLDRDFRPKLGDFGLSRMLTTIQASATNMSGTPTHMAPEQFIDDGKHDPMKADVYSFGMLLYELATNKIPFFGLPLGGISKKIEKGERPLILDETPIGMNENERVIWWGIVTKCWSQEPHSRPSMDEVFLRLLNLQSIVSSRIQGFCCKAHKIGQHDYFLSYRVSTESNIVHKLYDALSTTTRKSGEALKVFLDMKCLPDAEDWQKSFLYGLHNSKILVPIISASGLNHFQKAHEENDNVLLEYEHMLSLLKLRQGNVKVFPLFVGAIPRASDYPNKLHFSTGKHIQQTLKGILQLQGKSMGNMDEVVSDLLDKLDELESGANTHFTTHETRTTTDAQNEQKGEEEKDKVFIQVEGESTRYDHIIISPSSSLLVLRTVISEQLDNFDFEYKFTQKLRGKISTINLKQETFKTVKDIMEDYSITVQKI